GLTTAPRFRGARARYVRPGEVRWGVDVRRGVSEGGEGWPSGPGLLPLFDRPGPVVPRRPCGSRRAFPEVARHHVVLPQPLPIQPHLPGTAGARPNVAEMD